jgi:hypothetical protein
MWEVLGYTRLLPALNIARAYCEFSRNRNNIPFSTFICTGNFKGSWNNTREMMI